MLPIHYGHLILTAWSHHAIYRCLRKWMTLNYKFQGQLRSNVKTDLNSQHMISYLLPSLTVWPQHAICHCVTVRYVRKWMTLNYGFQGKLR